MNSVRIIGTIAFLALVGSIDCRVAVAAPEMPNAGQEDEAARIAAIVDPIIDSDLASSGIPGAAFVFVRDGKIVYQRGYGVSDVGKATPVDPDRTIWPIASITKAITAMGALQLVDQGRLELDTDINRYLKQLQVPSQGYGPLALRHLLSHTAALDELPGRQVDGKQAPDMGTFLKTRILRYRAPGVLTAYSTYGVALAGLLVEDASGQDYADYIRHAILEPAGMKHSWFMLKQGDEDGVATAYKVEDGKAEAVAYEWYVTPPTSSMVASASDMGRLLLVQLSEGSAGKTRILSPELTRAMQTQQTTVHPDIPGWGLGLQLDRVNGVKIAEHGGDIAGFSSLFSLIPEKNSGFFIVHHGESGDLRFRVRQALLDTLYPEKVAAVVPKADPKNAAVLREYSGRYISSLACRSCPDSEEQAFPLTVEPDGTLSLWGQKWVPLRRDLFIRDDSKRLLGFARNAEGSITAVSAGSWRVADRLTKP